ncbi:METTL5 family protein [Metallosphaera hakonensis]|uniref:Methyltransferase-like protein 5 n=1 Tax=Metallosphaera hakonensis JCM 8857 = DSM 7519 TaxID=1293036 RepID=A0A2U9ISB9_9CREN|nr:METTL5 family protein [Metallosphaera hakonensis]AWR98898.1 methyltransferase [Metallosphaera hakonensis JCM 8857 = DSM 7519]
MEKIPGHPSPKYELEQYITPSPIASTLIWTAYIQGNVKDKKVIDMGCGTGRLCAGASALGGYCTCAEIDSEALSLGKEVFEKLGLEAEFVETDCTQFHGVYDTVIQNPPFGNVKRGADLSFLRTALGLANTVYSIHKSNPNSRDLLTREARSRGFSVEVLPLSFPLTPYYPWHREKVYRFLVDIYIFQKIV